MRILLPAIAALALLAAACDDDEPDSQAVDREQTLNAGPETAPTTGGNLGADPVELVRGRIAAEFGDRPWADAVGEIEAADGMITVELDSTDQAEADEACTAIAGFVVAEESGVSGYGVRVEGDGITAEARPGEPQCDSA